MKRLSVADFPVPVSPIERIKIPASFSPRSPAARRDLASTVRNRLAGRDLPRHPGNGRGNPGAGEDGAGRGAAAIAELRKSVLGPGTDRYLTPELAAADELLRSGRLADAVRAVVGELR